MRRPSGLMRRLAWIALAGLTLGLLALRALVSIGDAEQAGSRAFDVVVLGIVSTFGLVGLMLWLIKSRVRAAARAVRRQHPEDVVLPIAIRAEDIAQLSALGALQQSPKPSYGAIVLGRTTCTWWIGAGSPRKIAELVSELPVEYSIGSYLHAGFAQTNLVANFTVSGSQTSIPLVLLREQGILLNRPRDKELEELVTLFTEAERH